MKSLPPHRFGAIVTLFCFLLPSGGALASPLQEESSPEVILLGRARTLEQRGRLDLAKQDWAKVLLTDANEAEALAGLVRAARAEGHTAEAGAYLARLRAAHPSDPEVTRLENGNKGRDAALEATEAARLARAGDARGAMVLYRRVYGMNPPPGAPALAYFETEARTEDGRPHAVAGLRALVDRYPGEPRYRVALGRVLLASPRTQAEGRTMLEGLPGNAAALGPATGQQQSASSAGAHPEATHIASAGGTARDSGEQDGAKRGGSSALSAQRGVPEQSNSLASGRGAGVPGQVSRSMGHPSLQRDATEPGARATARTVSAPATLAGDHLGSAAEERAAYLALTEHRTAEADQRFRQILAADPRNARALAGLGYLNVTTGDLKAAVTFFERAQENGDRSLALTRAMVNAGFELELQLAAGDRARGDQVSAEARFRAALRERPSNPEALDGLGETLLQAGRPGEAVPIFARLTQVRPMSPASWRGLVLAQAGAGNASEALATDGRVPADVKGPLQQDSGYLEALASARRREAPQLAQVELASRPTRAQPAQAPPEALAPTQPVAAPPRPTGAPPAAPTPGPVAPKASIAEPPRTASAGPARLTGDTGHKPATVKAETHPPAVTLPPVSKTTLASAEHTAKAPIAAAITPVSPVGTRPDEAIASERTEQGQAALLHGDNAAAANLFREAVAKQPGKSEAWRGLVLALYAAGDMAEAEAALDGLPEGAHAALDRDATFQVAAGSILLETNRPNGALQAFARAQNVFATQKLPPPVDLPLHIANLLAARGDDTDLYRELMYLGDRNDLSAVQRQQVQMVWTQWAVRRARALDAAGERHRAVALLNAAAEAFAGNRSVMYSIADGYAGVGLPREAVALYKTQDLSTAPARDVEAAISAATAAHDFKAAGSWARMGRQRFATDPEMFTVAAELEQARGHEDRAVGLTQQAKALAPAQNPGRLLTAELEEANAGQGWEPQPQAAGQLSVLLAPAEASSLADAGQGNRPYLPDNGDRHGSAPPVREAGTAPMLSSYDEPSR